MDIFEVVADDLADGRVVRDEIGKAQTPGTPVATHLTDDELTIGLGLALRSMSMLLRMQTSPSV